MPAAPSGTVSLISRVTLPKGSMELKNLLLSPTTTRACEPLVALAGSTNDACIEDIDFD
jgi:hypothetical protein